jgi:uncharacterized membrane protein
MYKPFTYRKFLQYFLQGLLILAPVTITLYALYWVYDQVDKILRPVVHIPGIGFIIVIATVVLVGWASSFFLMGRVFSVFDGLLEKTPGIKLIYGFVKDFFEAFAGNKKKFTESVLADIDQTGAYRIGFVTQKDMQDFDLEGYVAVYIPMAYSVAGNVYIVPASRIQKINSISPAQAMKFAVSGGVTDVAEE